MLSHKPIAGLLAAGLTASMVACTPAVDDAAPGAHRDSGSSTDPHSGRALTTSDSGALQGDSDAAADSSAVATDAGGGLGAWAPTANYPLATSHCVGTAPDIYCAPQTCVANAGSVYCVGGASTSTYFSPLSSAGLGTWARGADYPEPIQEASCVVSANVVYCVGGSVVGDDGGLTPTADVYYAPLSSQGIGAWTASTAYPDGASGPVCMVDSETIYCASGTDAYYAPLSSSGVGAWAPTTPPPTATARCFAIDGFAYCFGDGDCSPEGPGTDCYSPSYSAPLTPAGFGAWTSATELPTAVSANQATAGSYLYYLSVPVFVASVADGIIGPWQTTTNYPDSSYPSNCVSSDGYLYCASPLDGGSYFAPIGVPDPDALRLQNPPPFPRAEYLVPSCTSEGCSWVEANGVTVGDPTFGVNIDDAVVFDCASQASTSAGCTTTVTSPNPMGNYGMTIWYPCTSAGPAGTNCCYLAPVGYATPSNGWCISTSSNSFIISNEIRMYPPETSTPGDSEDTLPP
jgi:hypothetical protein